MRPIHEIDTSEPGAEPMIPSGCLSFAAVIGLSLVIIFLPAIIQEEMFGVLLLNPYPWLAGRGVLKRYGSDALGRAFMAFVLVGAISTFIFYWLTIFAYIWLNGWQIL
jgi:hypothetical protein